MHMAVLQFFGTGFTDFLDAHIEVQGLAGQGMVCVYLHLIVGDSYNRDDVHAAFLVGLELHADFDLFRLCEIRL